MNAFRQEYENKKITVDDAVGLIQSGNKVILGTGVCAPFEIMHNIHKAAPRVKDVDILYMASQMSYPYMEDPQYQSSFNNTCVFSYAADRPTYVNHTASYLPANLDVSAAEWIKAHGADIFYCAANPMDDEGNFRIAPCLTIERDAIENAKTIVLEVTPNEISMYGDTLINIKDVDYIVESESPILELPNAAPDEKSRIIGGYVSDLIHDGDCLQLGIGMIPNAVALGLKNKHDLGVHTELIVESYMELMECGAVNNSKKTLHPGKMIGCFITGTNKLYQYADKNPDIELYRAGHVINPRVIAQNDNMVSLNTGFSTDLTGQISSEALGTRLYSGTGGQASTALGATWSNGGRSIIALKSTVTPKNGQTLSNIKAVHDAGTVISLTRNVVDYVVTEYGVAHLKGKSISERIPELISIAHPNFREELRREAAKYY